MAAKTVGTRNRTKFRGELGTMKKFMKEKGAEMGRGSMKTSGGEIEEKEATRIEHSEEFESSIEKMLRKYMEEMLRKYTEEIEKLRNEMKEERRAWKKEREEKRAE